MNRPRSWWMQATAMAAAGLLCAVLAAPLATLGLPSASLFVGLVSGAVVAMSRVATVESRPVTSLAHAGVGVAIASSLDDSSLGALTHRWQFVLASVAFTVAASLMTGHLFAFLARSTKVTGVFSMLAGGASGISAMSGELGADQRVVASAQYTRLVAVITTLPLVAAAIGTPQIGDSVAIATRSTESQWTGAAVAVVAIAVGIPLARLVRLPVPALLGPLVLGLVAVLLLPAGWSAPQPLSSWSFAVVGLSIGLSFDRKTLRLGARASGLSVVMTALLIAATAGISRLFSVWWDVDPLTAYLASSPGGIYAVLAFAVSASPEPALVALTQASRLVVILLMAPLLARWLTPGR